MGTWFADIASIGATFQLVLVCCLLVLLAVGARSLWRRPGPRAKQTPLRAKTDGGVSGDRWPPHSDG